MLRDYLDTTTTKTHDAYVGVPLANHSSGARGDLLERVARRVMERKVGEKTCDAAPGVCVNGRKRGRNRESHDFMMANRRVEVKTAQLGWDRTRTRWRVPWKGIKRDAHDDLLLVLYTPFGLYLFKHDHTYGVSTTGKAQSSAGGVIQVYGPKNESSISAALEVLLAKLQPMHYATLAY
jgi:hypothetical protein